MKTIKTTIFKQNTRPALVNFYNWINWKQQHSYSCSKAAFSIFTSNDDNICGFVYNTDEHK